MKPSSRFDQSVGGVSESKIITEIYEESVVDGSFTASNANRNSLNKKPTANNLTVPSTNHRTNQKPAVPDLALNNNNQLLRLYDENIELKKKQQNLQKKITELRDMLELKAKQDPMSANDNNKHNDILELARLRKENRDLLQTVNNFKGGAATRPHSSKAGKGPVGLNASIMQRDARKALKEHENEKIQELLKMIQMHKKQVVEGQLEIKSLQRENYLLKQQLSTGQELRSKQIQKIELDIMNDETHKTKLRNTQKDLETAKEKIGYLEAEIGKLNSILISKRIMQDELQNLRVENRRLEDQIRKLSQSPLFQDFTQKIADESKIKSLQDKIKLTEEKYNKEKQKSIQLETELKMVQGQLIEATHDAQRLERQNIDIKSKVKQNPIVDMIAKDQEMLHKVLGYLKAENYRTELLQQVRPDSTRLAKVAQAKKVEELIAEKEVLAAELQRLQVMIQSLKEAYEQREKIHQLDNKEISAEKEALNRRINDLEILAGHKAKAEVLRDGVRYQDNVSVFSSEETTVENGFNYFDVYLGNVVLVDNLVRTETGLSDPKKLISFATVDFFNHRTENSKFGTGTNYNMNSQFSFKVSEDNFLCDYLDKGFLVIEIWASEGSKATSLGVCKIGLKPLIIKSKPNVAPVVNSSVPIYLNTRAMGSLNFVIRMRLPIFQQLRKYKTGSKVSDIPFMPVEAEKRKLIINLSQANGLKPGANTFVYYCLHMNDYFTNTHSGSNPKWDHWNVVDVVMTKDFQNYLSKSEIEFTVFDDNAPINDDQLSDIVGTVKIPLYTLLEEKPIQMTNIPVKSGAGSVTGYISFKVFWHNQDNAALLNMNKKIEPATIDWEEDTTNKVKEWISKNKLTARQAYLKFDRNATDLVSKSELDGALMNLDIRLSKKQLDAYYNTFSQPLNLKSFTKKYFGDQMGTNQSLKKIDSSQNLNSNRTIGSQKKVITQEIRNINQFIKNNSVEIKKINLREFLKDKDIFQLALQIDRNNDGVISRAELQAYLLSNGVEAYIESENVNIIDFLKKYSSNENSARTPVSEPGFNPRITTSVTTTAKTTGGNRSSSRR